MNVLIQRSKTLISDFVSLIFPQQCVACEETLTWHERNFCMHCLFSLPRTDFHLHEENPVMRRFWGRVPLKAAAAFLVFEKEGKVQRLMHAVKYQGRQEAAIEVGELFGNELKKSPLFHDVTHIIPVPLHRDKLRRRGYNQAEVFARGLAKAMGATLDTTSLLRVTATSTQTRKNRFDRWKNVEEVFSLGEAPHLHGQHILLVDDVVTTGATFEACAQHLTALPGVRISLAAMATAQG